MKILSIEEQNEILELCKMESDIINKMFSLSNNLGEAMFKNSCSSFEEFLTQKHGEFVRAMSSEWRYFLTTLLGLIDEEYLEVVMPSLF